MQDYNNFFGEFGGRYVAEVLRQPLDELEAAYLDITKDKSFRKEFEHYLKVYVGRPTPLLFAENLSKTLGGGNLFIKMEGLAHTGAHKINNALGQILLAKRMGKKRIIAETGAGQHGVATAAVCAKFGIPCRVYMGEVDMKRQRPNVFRMETFGAEVVAVKSGSRTLKDAVNEALRDWASSFDETYYLLGSALGPSPYPDMVRFFQSIIGREVKSQAREQKVRIDKMVACVGGGSNAIGFFSPFLEKKKPHLIGVEAGGRGKLLGEHAARMNNLGRDSVVQGYRSLFLLDDDGQVATTHSISAGLDYPGIGPQLAFCGETGRIEFVTASDVQALEAIKIFARNEGVFMALESAHAAAYALKILPTMKKGENLVVNMSGSGDKDIFITAKELDREKWIEFLKKEAADE
ncbi:MAG: tryptophan synthase subunit beta [Spirochaetales bacterium]|nr:tryptophan synthase subunit beta [Spirochaetales bacterium]